MKTIENISFISFKKQMLEQQQKIAELQIKHDWTMLKDAIQPSHLAKSLLGPEDGKLSRVARFLGSLMYR